MNIEFIALGLLKDAAKQLATLEGENLLAYARTFAVLAKTAVDLHEKEQAKKP